MLCIRFFGEWFPESEEQGSFRQATDSRIGSELRKIWYETLHFLILGGIVYIWTQVRIRLKQGYLARGHGMMGRRHSKMIRLEILLFALGCVGTVIFAWSVRPQIDASADSPEGPYTFAVTTHDEMRYLQDLKMPEMTASDSRGEVARTDTTVPDSEFKLDDATVTLPVLPDITVEAMGGDANPYLNVD
jgi:hypothetical protein